MLMLKITFYILAAIATCGLSYEASAAPSDKLSIAKELRISNFPSLNQTATPAPDKIAPATKLAQVLLSDIKGNWAQSTIQALAARGIIQGFPDGSFRPDQPVTRAEFAAMISKAFGINPIREAIAFIDVPANYWAEGAIGQAYQMGFMAGYPGDNIFNPEQNIPRVQALVSLSNGLKLATTGKTGTALDTYFQDAAQIPDYAVNSVAGATEKRLVVNYPNIALLNPNQLATRADVAAFIYQALVSTGELPPLQPGAIASQYIAGPGQTASVPPTPTVTPPSAQEVQKLQSQLSALERTSDFGNIFQGSPGITIAVPSGFGADQNTVFVGATYQSSTRQGDADDAALGFGIGVGNSRKSVGVELSYTLASLTAEYDDFGDGGFNIKIHRQLPGDFAVAVGYNGFLKIGSDNAVDDSLYGVVTKVFRTRENVNLPLSRLAVTVGVGNGQFRTGGDIEDDEDSANVFGSAVVRLAQPVSLIAEWTGQDLAFGLSIVPLKKSNWVITPAFRDVAGEGDKARFVLGTGISFRF